MGGNGWKGVHFPPESAFVVFIVNLIEELFRICTLTWRLKNYFSRQGKNINRRKESTILLLLYKTVQNYIE